MSSTTFTVHTSLSPNEVMALMTDFGPSRVANWPNIDEAHFEVHETGPDWAEVTEGTAMGWERERYSWDAAAGTIAIETLDSNLWGPGSGWRYQLTPAGDGTDVEVTLTRVPKSIAARVLAALIPVVGGRTLGKQLGSVFRKAESRERFVASCNLRAAGCVVRPNRGPSRGSLMTSTTRTRRLLVGIVAA